MRLKTFHDKTMQAVMAQVRDSLGPDAIIISVEEGAGVVGVRVTAALEAAATPAPPEVAPTPNPSPLEMELASPFGVTREFDNADITAVLNHHDLPPEVAARLREAIDNLNSAALVDAFAHALEVVIRFSPLTDVASRPIMLVGLPGAGKTVSSAKLAANAVLHRRRVKLISTDTVKAGGVGQLDHFAQLMKLNVSTADTPDELAAILRHDGRSGHKPDLTIIDTSGVNPFDMDDLTQLLKFVRAVDAEPVPVIPAGLNALDAQEIASVFAHMGSQRFIATRLDASRRYGSVIAAARPQHLALAAFSRSPFIAEGLEQAAAASLARLLVALPKLKSPSPRSDRSPASASHG